MPPDTDDAAVQADAYIDALLAAHRHALVPLTARRRRRRPARHAAGRARRDPTRSKRACRGSTRPSSSRSGWPNSSAAPASLPVAARGEQLRRSHLHRRHPANGQARDRLQDRALRDRRLLGRRRHRVGLFASPAQPSSHGAGAATDAHQAALRRAPRVIPTRPVDALPRLPGDALQQAARQEPARLPALRPPFPAARRRAHRPAARPRLASASRTPA